VSHFPAWRCPVPSENEESLFETLLIHVHARTFLRGEGGRERERDTVEERNTNNVRNDQRRSKLTTSSLASEIDFKFVCVSGRRVSAVQHEEEKRVRKRKTTQESRNKNKTLEKASRIHTDGALSLFFFLFLQNTLPVIVAVSLCVTPF
jgi:hypothetical protein